MIHALTGVCFQYLCLCAILATHFSILAWEIPWAEESGGLQFIGSQRVGHDLVIKQQYERTSRIAGIVYFSNLNYSNFYLKNTFLEN